MQRPCGAATFYLEAQQSSWSIQVRECKQGNVGVEDWK